MKNQPQTCFAHNYKILDLLCVYNQCDQPKRLACEQCQQLHDHNEILPKAHLLSLIRVKKLFKQVLKHRRIVYRNQINLVNHCIDNFLNIFSSIQKASKELQLILDEQLANQTNIIQLESMLSNLNTIQDIQQLNYDSFAQMFNQQSAQYQSPCYQKLLTTIEEIKDKASLFQTLSQQYLSCLDGDFTLYFGDKRHKMIVDNKQTAIQIELLQNIGVVLDNIDKYRQEANQRNPPEQMNYYGIQQHDQLQIIQFDEIQIHSTQISIYTSTISPDEKFLGYGGQGEFFFVRYLKDQGKITKIRMEFEPTSSTFSIDSKKLILGGYGGEMICFEVKYDFSCVFLAQVHKDRINSMICINDYEILSISNTNMIIITNLESGEQVTQIAQEFDQIYGLSYDFEFCAIFTGAQDYCIRIFNKDNGKLVLQQKDAHLGCLLQLQFIQKQNKLLSLCENGILKVWFVDYNRKSLLEIQSIKESNMIQNFTSLQNDHILILISNNQIKLSWKKNHKNLIFAHQVKDFFLSTQNQVESLNMIVLRGEYQINMLIKQDQQYGQGKGQL